VSSTLRKCVSFGPPPSIAAPQLPQPTGYANDYLAHDNPAHVRETGTRWIKLWARWDQIQPLPPERVPTERLDDPANPGLPYVQALDAQIAHARSQDPPLGVMVQSYHFPRWANGTGDVVSGRFSRSDFDFHPELRMSPEARAARDYDAPRKLLAFRLPPLERMGVDGIWGRWVRFLYERYMGHRCAFVLDLLNEPNNQWWPQRGAHDAARYAATMMAAAQSVAAEHGHPSPLGAPGTADIVGPTGALLTSYPDFVPALLSHLEADGFEAHPQFIWTHHNYVDMEDDLGAGAPAPRTRAAYVRDMLAGRWSGWRGRDASVPGLWLTEGGVRVNRLRERRPELDAAAALELQAELIRRNWDRHASDEGPDGPGIEMLTNYLMYTDLGYDTGLREPVVPGTPRPAYETWRELPSNA